MSTFRGLTSTDYLLWSTFTTILSSVHLYTHVSCSGCTDGGWHFCNLTNMIGHQIHQPEGWIIMLSVKL